MRRVVISGVGLATGLGVGTAATWAALLDGKSAVAPLRAYAADSLKTRMGAEIPDFHPAHFVAQRRMLRNMTRNDQLAVAGAALALADARPTLDDPDHTGLFIGGNKEISEPSKVLDAVLLARNSDGTADVRKMGTEGAAQFYPLFYVEGLQAAALFYISQAHGLRGANTYFAGSGEVGITAIGRAYRAVSRGETTMAVAGSFDDPTSWWSMTKLEPRGVLSGRNDLGTGAVRPYDRDRDGFVAGDGAAFVVLEDAESAAARGADIYAEVVGFGAGFDLGGLITPSPDGRAMTGAIEAALEDAGVGPEAVDYIATEGDATVPGDIAESAALRAAFGTDGRAAASSVKAATGHLVAGSGALNVAVAALATRHQVAPPTVNLTTVDPACADIDWVIGQARDLRVDHALALSRGFAGQNVALLLRAVSAGRTTTFEHENTRSMS